MALFKYEAKNKEGEIYERQVEAADRLALYTVIRNEGGTVVSIKEVNKLLPEFSLRKLFGGISTQNKINIAKSLASMIDAGLSITRALGVMEKQTKRGKLKTLIGELESDVSHGITLSEALSKRPDVFSALFVSMVKAGEESGSISASLRMVGAQMEKSHQLVKKVRGAMIYPAVIIVVMIIIAILLLIFMVPTLTATFEGLGVKLPLPTRILIYLSKFLINNVLLVSAAFLGTIAAFIALAKSSKGKRILDIVYIHLPVVGTIVREAQVARAARTLSSLLSSGVEIIAAFEVTSDVIQNHLYKEVLDEAGTAVAKGEQLSKVFEKHENLYPIFVSEMMSVGEETGKISLMLEGVAQYYEEEVDQKTKDLSTIIEPVLMIIIGIGVGTFAISMLAPTYSLVDYL